MEYIIGVDIGTTCTKAILYRSDHQVTGTFSCGYDITSLFPGWCEQNPEIIFQAVLKAIGQATSKIPMHQLLGFSFSSAMHSLIAVDSNGVPLTECIIWGDTRSRMYSEALNKTELGKQIYNSTGTPIHPMMPLTKICWQRDFNNEVFQNTYKFIGIKEYIIFKLTGEYLIDYSIASATGLFNIKELKWYEPAMNYSGINEAMLSTLVTPEHIIYSIKQEYKELLSLNGIIGIVVGASDGCLANVGANVLKKQSASITIGTSGAIRITTKDITLDREGRLFCYILDKEHYVLGGAVNNGGIILRWLKEKILPIMAESSSIRELDYNEILDLSKDVSPGAAGLIFLPYLLGERAPHWDPDARGVYFGMNLSHTYKHFIRATIEGIIFGIYSIFEIIEQNYGVIETIYAGGGFAQSRFWLQMLSDVFNKKVILSSSIENSGVGAAILGFKAFGKIKSLSDRKISEDEIEVIVPNQVYHNKYMQNYAIYKRLYSKLKDEFKLISQLQQDNEEG